MHLQLYLNAIKPKYINIFIQIPMIRLLVVDNAAMLISRIHHPYKI